MPPGELALAALAVFAVAALYSSVGHAGASGYLAVMTLLFGLTEAVAKPTATTLNILVASVTTIQFARAGCVPWRRLAPFVLGSVPLAFFGGVLKLTDPTYKRVVGVVLLLSAVRLAVQLAPAAADRRPTVWLAVLIGAGVGLLAGLTGTGGGVFLTPVLLLFRWADAKPAAGASAAFILANSVAGLAGQAQKGLALPPETPYLLAAAGLGGLLGSTLGAWRFGGLTLRRVLAGVLLLAGGKLILGA